MHKFCNIQYKISFPQFLKLKKKKGVVCCDHLNGFPNDTDLNLKLVLFQKINKKRGKNYIIYIFDIYHLQQLFTCASLLQKLCDTPEQQKPCQLNSW